MKTRLLDLFCGAGGAAKGYADAGRHCGPQWRDILTQAYAHDVLFRLGVAPSSSVA